MAGKIEYRDENGVRIQTYKRFKEGRDYEAVEPNDMVALADDVLENVQQLRENIGRPRKYETVEEFISVTEAYITYIRDANARGIKLIPDIEGLCAFMGISRETLNEWEKSRQSRYSDAIKSVKNQIAYFKKQLALKGKIPPIVFATDFNNNHGYTQKQEIVVTPNNPLGDPVDITAIAEKYAEALPPTTIKENEDA